MLVENQIFHIKLSGKTIPHYRSLGYDIKDIKSEIDVPVEHLTKGSHQKIELICDRCGEHFYREYKLYIKNQNDSDYCTKCAKGFVAHNTLVDRYGVNGTMLIPESRAKIIKTNQERYGVDWISQSDVFKEKTKETCLKKYGREKFLAGEEIHEVISNTVLEKYGVDNIRKVPEIIEKTKQTNLEKYGHTCALQAESAIQKSKETCLKKYGTECWMQSEAGKDFIKKRDLELFGNENIFKSELFKEKSRQTCLQKYGKEYYTQTEQYIEEIKKTNNEKYGVDFLVQSEEFRRKSFEKRVANGNGIATSSQQIAVYEMIKQRYDNTILNYPMYPFYLDIFVEINGVKIDVEYDGWYWHQDSQKDIKRDKVIQAQDVKVLRIRSGLKIPNEEELFYCLNLLVNDENKMFHELFLSDWKQKEEVS